MELIEQKIEFLKVIMRQSCGNDDKLSFIFPEMEKDIDLVYYNLYMSLYPKSSDFEDRKKKIPSGFVLDLKEEIIVMLKGRRDFYSKAKSATKDLFSSYGNGDCSSCNADFEKMSYSLDQITSLIFDKKNFKLGIILEEVLKNILKVSAN